MIWSQPSLFGLVKKMKIALFTGTAFRHKYFANTILKNYRVDLHIRMKRGKRIIDETKFPSGPGQQLLKIHSEKQLEKEREYFLPEAKKFLEAKQVIESDDPNIPEIITAVKRNKPDIVLVYGTKLLKKNLLDVMPRNTINLHAGLSPYYKGAATLYWPIYFMEPQYVGFTFHLIDKKIDHGDIIHQNRPKIYPEDEIHDLGCRTIIVASKDILKILKKKKIEHYKQKQKGKIFYSWDFKPYHLRVTNYLMKNGLLKEYLINKSYFPEPKIISQV